MGLGTREGREGKGREGKGGFHWGGGVGRDSVDEEGRFYEEGLVGCELGRGGAGADVQGYDWGFEIAVDGC